MRTIGRYQIKDELGRGGMAVVYRAIDPHIGRTVALKLLPSELSQNPKFRMRFQREMQTIGTLTHPAIVPLYDAGEHNGQPYLVMRLMAGGSLLDRLKQGPVSLPETIGMLNRLASALDEAHSQNIIHRDLKPGNILLDEQGLPYLSDFGIAKLTDVTSMTSQGAIGTPAYMSPDHFEGQITLQSDIYALGMILYQMLTGELPYQASTPAEWIRVHLLEVPTPICAIDPTLPPAIEAIINKALAKHPEHRYSSASKMAWDLQIIVNKEQGVRNKALAIARETEFENKPTVIMDVKNSFETPSLLKNVSFRWVHFGVIGFTLAILIYIFINYELALTVNWGVDKSYTSGTITLETQATSSLSPTQTISTQLSEMVRVPAGEFTMGSETGEEDEKPVHIVYLDEYYIDKYEVTNAQYRVCVEAEVCVPPWNQERYGDVTKANHPVGSVYWEQAVIYCEWAGKRLPTEAEWEKAARGTDGRVYPWGNEFDGTRLNLCDNECKHDWGDKSVDDGYAETAPVGFYESGKSPYGAYDMAGNVWEWVSSKYQAYPYQADDGREELIGTEARVYRGGAWYNGAPYLRVSNRSNYELDVRDINVGFRCAVSP